MIEYKVGQVIVIDTRSGRYGADSIQPPYKIEKITKVTPTQITTSDGRRYLKSTKHEVGNRWGDYAIAFNYFNNHSLTTEEEALKANKEWEEEHRIALMRRYIDTVSWRSITPEKIELIYKILKGE